jgi:Carboxypeptidase regulatory-like domain
MRGTWNRILSVAAMFILAVAAYAEVPMTKLTIAVKTQSGRPVGQAAVIVRFVKGHSVVKLGKAVRTQWELRSNQDGEATIPAIPQGQIRIQIIANGYQTYGDMVDVTDAEKTINIKLNPPQQQYTSH